VRYNKNIVRGDTLLAEVPLTARKAQIFMIRAFKRERRRAKRRRT
jgi:hypothetical protein